MRFLVEAKAEDVVLGLSDVSDDDYDQNRTWFGSRRRSSTIRDPDYCVPSQRGIRKIAPYWGPPRRSERLSAINIGRMSNAGAAATANINGGSGISTTGAGRRRGRRPSRGVENPMERGGMEGVQVPRRTRGRRVRVPQPLPALMDVPSEETKPFTMHRSIISWLIDSKVINDKQEVRYVDLDRKWAMLHGIITRAGIECFCCSRVYTVAEFEVHARGRVGKPYRSVSLKEGDDYIPLLSYQAIAWTKQDEKIFSGSNNIQLQEGSHDRHDDTCIWCADGGDLLCCEGCPTTFHRRCIDLPVVPQSEWFCPYCYCIFCKDTHDLSLKCSLCLKTYHKNCMQANLDSPYPPIGHFCAESCRKIYVGLENMVGITNILEKGLTWTLLQRKVCPRAEAHTDKYYAVVQGNSKLAVAWSVMEEGFLTIIDEITRINVIKSVVYGCVSNFPRINFRGFYTAILERGDELISVATLRFHGPKFAEMPFITTREQYRNQGMCRVLLDAIEKMLSLLSIENLVIPSIAARVDSWALYGFQKLEDDLEKHMKNFNTVMFPDLVRLQKKLPKYPQFPIELNRFAHPQFHSEMVAEAVGSTNRNAALPESQRTRSTPLMIDLNLSPPSDNDEIVASSDMTIENT